MMQTSDFQFLTHNTENFYYIISNCQRQFYSGQGQGQGHRILKMLDSSEFANFLLNAHNYRPEVAKYHSPGWNEVNPRVNDVLPTIRTLKVCNKRA
jgi:hypothetical protein